MYVLKCSLDPVDVLPAAFHRCAHTSITVTMVYNSVPIAVGLLIFVFKTV